MKNKETAVFTSFAAANGYLGFRSYFADAFNSRDFTKIFVLKGGPGTGKSSFMKRVRDSFGNEYEKEEILCSSDPDSLDGLIVKSKNGKIAIIDGTAPHERDAVIPGAIDEIINLGDFWDSSWLKASRESILRLSEQKSKAYKCAYSYLKIAGAANSLADGNERARFDFKKARALTKSLIPDSVTHGAQRARLFSSFGKHGIYKLDTLARCSERIYSLFGSAEAVSMLFEVLAERVREVGAEAIIAPSPLDGSKTEAVFLYDKTAFTEGGNGEGINADEFWEIDAISDERKKRAKEIHTASLAEAERWFKIASDIHSELEKIYSSSMNFDKIDAIYERVLGESEKILSLS